MKDISNSDDIIDSRDVIERIEELESEIESLKEAEQEYIDEDANDETHVDYPQYRRIKNELGDLEEELKILTDFQDELEGYCEWKDGATLIRDDYFTEYSKELCIELGDIPKNLPYYIESNINWTGVAEDLQADYTSGEFDGVTYWAR